MGVRSSNINRGPNNRSDGHLLNYIRNTFARGGGAISLSARFYSVTPSTTSLNEGSSVTFTVNTANIPDGTTLYWTLNTISGTINASDFSGGATSGSFTVTNGTGSVVLTLANDLTTEGSESFQLQVRTDSVSGSIVATSSTITINDTSTQFAATGGTVIDSGGFRIHVFTSPGSFVVSSLSPTVTTVEYLVVAGGGGGGVDTFSERSAGGGGAGGFRTASGFPVTVATYPITVGGGGNGGTTSPNPATRGNSGNPSIFDIITSAGGGGGAGHDGSGNIAALPGGSGGGSTHDNTNGTRGLGNQPPVSPPQGNDGGTATNTVGGNGSPITWLPASYGTPGPAPGRYFAGGGGAATSPGYSGGGGGGASQTGQPGFPRAGGAGGGGPGGFSPGATAGAGTAGTTNTGGGGGGSRQTPGGNGGSGIVAIRYPIP